MNPYLEVLETVAALVVIFAWPASRVYRWVHSTSSGVRVLLAMHNWPKKPPAGHIWVYEGEDGMIERVEERSA